MSSHLERAQLLAAIAARPDDDALRRSLADCLEHAGESARAAFIRAQLVPTAADVTSLQTLSIELETDVDIAELAGLSWDRLRVLAIHCPRIGDAALRALADAHFTPHLSRLLIMGRPATPTIKDSSQGLQALRSALSSSELSWPHLSEPS